MAVTIAAEPQLFHAVPGRVRVHVPALAGYSARSVEAQVRRVPGVRDVEANPFTGNVLVRFDPRATTARAILDALRTPGPGPDGSEPGPQPVADARAVREEARTSPPAHTRAPRVLSSGRSPMKQARIAVHGLDCDPDLARRVVARLERYPSVRARASPLTGRVLVEFDVRRTDIEDLLAAVAAVELPALPGEDTPSHPLDPAPLIQSAARTVGAILGLGLVTVQRVAGIAVVTPGAATAAGILDSVQGLPLTRNGLRALLGRDRADLLLSGASIVALALSNSPLGLLTTGAEALRLLTEVVARRAAWGRYEQRMKEAATSACGGGDAAEAVPGAVIRLKAGQRAPLAATVVEGTGTAIDRDGTPLSVGPGSTISAGAQLQGGPFVVELRGERAFAPEPRPAPPAPSLLEHYQRALGPLALAYAAGTALVTRSPARALEALLLVNPRTALIGAEAASTGAAARVLRAEVTVVGTRPIRRPDALLLDRARVLTDGAALTDVLPLDDARNVAEVQAVAAAVAAAAGSPWGGAFRAAGEASGTDGAFDGTTAIATIGGTRYTLAPRGRGSTARRQNGCGGAVPSCSCCGARARRAHSRSSPCSPGSPRVSRTSSPRAGAMAWRSGCSAVRTRRGPPRPRRGLSRSGWACRFWRRATWWRRCAPGRRRAPWSPSSRTACRRPRPSRPATWLSASPRGAAAASPPAPTFWRPMCRRWRPSSRPGRGARRRPGTPWPSRSRPTSPASCGATGAGPGSGGPPLWCMSPR
jgi:copper chaperone CopZ